MQVSLKVRRHNPGRQDRIFWETFFLDAPQHFTIIDALIQIREEIDGTPVLRCSCRSVICGMCGACVSDCTVLEAELKYGKPYDQTSSLPLP